MNEGSSLKEYEFKKAGEWARLYKFCSLESAVKIIGDTSTLFARKLNSFNDVFEMIGSVTNDQKKSILDMISIIAFCVYHYRLKRLLLDGKRLAQRLARP